MLGIRLRVSHNIEVRRFPARLHSVNTLFTKGRWRPTQGLLAALCCRTEIHPWRVVGLLCCLGHKHGGGHGIYGRENSRPPGRKDNHCACSCCTPQRHAYWGGNVQRALSLAGSTVRELMSYGLAHEHGWRTQDGSVRGVAARMEDVAKPGFLLVWCGIHQVDLVMKRVFTALKSSVFLQEDCSSRTIVLEIRPLTVRELAISTANCHSCGEQNCNNLRTKTLMSTDCRYATVTYFIALE
jgi:hypothetical protein